MESASISCPTVALDLAVSPSPRGHAGQARAIARGAPGLGLRAEEWDGFRALVFKSGDEVYLQSRDEKPLARYFAELEQSLRATLPARCVLDGEIVIVTDHRLDFDALLLRTHSPGGIACRPARGRVAVVVRRVGPARARRSGPARESPARRAPRDARARARRRARRRSGSPPVSRDVEVARDWFHRFEGAGLDGVIAKRDTLVYTPGQRVMTKVKHQRTADCVVAGFRWYKGGKGELVGSLLLGLYDAGGRLPPRRRHVGVHAGDAARARRSARAAARQRRRGTPVARLGGVAARRDRPPPARRDQPLEPRQGSVVKGAVALRALVCEVAYDHLQGTRFRHAAKFKRWRPDKPPAECRYDQLDATPAIELARLFAAAA